MSAAERVSDRIYSVRKPITALWMGAIVGGLGGLIGLGGAEFRLPLLIGVFDLYPHRAVRINLLISLATLLAAAVSRFGLTGIAPSSELVPVIVAMAAGGVLAAWFGAGLIARIPKQQLLYVIVALLLAISGLLLFEAFGHYAPSAAAFDQTWAGAVAFLAGLFVGAISSLLGVAGGEFIIPILIFAFGVDIKVAGTASVLISIPTVLTGVVRHWIEGKFRSRSMLQLLAIPMSLGSVLGAIIGAALAVWVATGLLKGILAVILAVSAVKLLAKQTGKAPR
jgi:uncharacterized membrane protein YfcA